MSYTSSATRAGTYEREQTFHMNKCLYSKAQKMLDPQQCASYRFAQHAASGDTSYTFSEALDTCRHDILNTTTHELRDLCTRISNGYRHSEILRAWDQ